MCVWNGRGGACVPARTSAQRRFHTKNTRIVCGDERWMRPCRATRAGTQAPPLPISIIFFHTIPHKPNNHLYTIQPNGTVGAVPVCPPERPQVRICFLTFSYLKVYERNDKAAAVF